MNNLPSSINSILSKSIPTGFVTAMALNSLDEVVVFDFETTGLSPEKFAEIIEIGAVRLSLKEGRIEKAFKAYIKPSTGVIPEKITKLTGISTELVSNAPYFESVLPSFYAFIGDLPLFAHNARFDKAFLVHYMLNCGLIMTNPVYCTLELDKFLYPNEKKHTLSSICERYGYSDPKAHRAINDAKATAAYLLMARKEAALKGYTAPFKTDEVEKLNILNLNNLVIKRIAPYNYPDKKKGRALFFTTNVGNFYLNVDRNVFGVQNMLFPANMDLETTKNAILSISGLKEGELRAKYFPC